MVTEIIKDEASGQYRVTFSLGRFQNNQRKMVVAGSFNDWSTEFIDARSGLRHAPEQFRKVTVLLEPGFYEYKYYDAASGQWMEVAEQPELYNAGNHAFNPNAYGTRNCALMLP